MPLLVGVLAVGLMAAAPGDTSTADGKPEKHAKKSGGTVVLDPEKYAGMEVCATCHEDKAREVAKTVHGAAKLPARIAKPLWGCEGCHGPGKAHAESGGDTSLIHRLSQATPEERTAVCLSCHGGQDERINFRRSEHQIGQVSCDSCHAPHGEGGHERLLRKEPNDLCFSCHGEKRNDFSLPFHHKVPEGLMKCVDCHNQHGGFTRQQRAFGTDAPCLRCHSDKQGPFTYEHLALRLEGCTGCHLPHGSNNPRLLTRSEQRFVCLECHSQIVSPGEEFPTVGTPTFHNLSQGRYQTCTTCHVMIHGSNISNVFFE
ncbi:MAG TPA: DmsE family decaheme c-type cytochrome [Candidatus Polarisedimenticolia bacterium]|nr:DmsE family decaheme c-type cytochrome [Candidatus Polarisedimenticolia bacterium]